MALVKLNNRGVRSVSTFGSISSLGTYTFIKKLTASSSGTLSFVDGSSDVVLDNTYPLYKFEFINLHPSHDNLDLQFNGSADTGSNYNVTKTTSFFRTEHDEGDTGTELAYNTGRDVAQGTGFATLIGGPGNDNDQATSGYLYLFNPSSTTYVKHFLASLNTSTDDNKSRNSFVSGYFNTTSAIDAIQFKNASNDIDAGKIKLYGLKDS